ncbi:MAG: ParB/RepB/Spo0J family partition protein [Candidatus Rokubacteria bacterium]|nr:ParB/RepB/Spo0J family partition protein [Candidatus Rokubacteria bacterium]
MERRLGQGLGSLLSKPAAPEGPQELALERIRPNPQQPRTTFDPAGLDELRRSLREHGVLQPIVVRPRDDGYEIVAGERRWRAARLAGLATIPALVREGVTDAEMLELALVENVQRNDLDPIEKARAFRALQTRLGLSQEAVAEKVGLQRATVANLLRLLELPAPAQEAVSRGLVSMGHARALLGLAGEPAQLRLLERIAREGLSVRRVEELVRAAAQSPEPPAPAAGGPEPEPPWTRPLQRRLQEALGTRVRLTADEACRGQIVIDFYERADLERLLARLAPAEELL